VGQKQLESTYPGEAVSYGIRRIEFDQYLLQRCEASVLPPQACKHIEKTDDGWLINDSLQTKLLVGAGGHYCPVARAIGSKKTGELAVVAQEAEFLMSAEQKLNCSIQPQVPELFFTSDLKGYGWVFRKGDYLNIGLGREDKHKLPGHVKSFCEYLAKMGKIPDDVAAHYDGHAYLLYHHAERKLIAENALLIGDSAGLAYPQSGEGIRPAVESAILAANVIRESAGDYSLVNLQAYNSMMEQRFGKRQAEPSIMERLPNWMKKTLASQLMKTHWFTKNIVTDKWFLQSHQAPMPAIKK
jgi:flavin-dependent dehydrogenase